MDLKTYLFSIKFMQYIVFVPVNSQSKILFVDNFDRCTVHPDTIKVFYLPTDAQ